MKDWIKLHRKIVECPVFANEKLLKIWIWCLCKASYKERDIVVGKQIVQLKKGQFVFGRYTAAEELNLNARTIYGYMQMLEKLNMIEINTNNKFSLITLINWEFYQADQDIVQQQKNNKVTSKEHQKNTNNKVNNSKNSKNTKSNNICANDLEEFFNRLWKLYPRKVGKGKVSYAKKVKLYNIGYDKLAQCIEMFKVDHENTEEKYIPHGSTFFNSGYVDYLDKIENDTKENKSTKEYPDDYWQSV